MCLYDVYGHVKDCMSGPRAGICKRLRCPGIDSANLCSLADRSLFVVPVRYRFLGSLDVYKFGLCCFVYSISSEFNDLG